MLETEAENITKGVSDFVIYTEGSIPWETAWHLSVIDQTILLESFNSLIEAKSGNKKKDVMTQEMIPDNSPDPESNE